ncbi:uncharacterized protein LOC126880090 [Diabrotica virgifera virgifera]|uniref:Uncharacterized protein n=1 Tax=Diabrotica virgifera virgifera TaxID=50390 RepID=A0ABM5JP56_DIAVI|nr:uncharacterized protein LOC126880090 [Diabrotica virgifera virgifera]
MLMLKTPVTSVTMAKRVQFLRELHKNVKEGCVPSNDEEFLEVENLIPENKSESCSPTGENNILEEDLNLSDDSVADPDYVLPKENFMKHPVEILQNNDSNSDTENIPVLQTLTSRNDTKRKGRTRREREECKRLRNAGESYTTEKGKTKPKRLSKNLLPCRLKCAERFSEAERATCFNDYWKLGSRDRRAMYISGLVSILPKKTQKTDGRAINRECYCTYKLIVNNEAKRTCKECFCRILGETKGFINVLVQKKKFSSTGIIESDQRGVGPPANKKSIEDITSVKNHILSFPSYESHYCRKSTNKKYLSPDLSIAKMYRLYKETCLEPVSLKLYSNCFHDLKLSFKKPSKDTCHTCDIITMQMKLAEENGDLKIQLAEHHLQAEKAYSAKRASKVRAQEDSSFQAYAFDLQQCLPTPLLQTSIAFYKRQLWTFNLTVHNLATDEATCYMWDETIGARGANQIASCLWHFCLNYLPPVVKEITFFSDTCGGQNKNNIVAMMFTFLLDKHSTLEIVNHKFLLSGHSHMECDSDHAIIEKTKKNTNEN